MTSESVQICIAQVVLLMPASQAPGGSEASLHLDRGPVGAALKP